MAAPQLSVELSLSIERCAAALHDLARLKEEVTALKSNGDGMAHFASALFELEMARQGDVESRMEITHLAEVLLVFWSDGSGDTLSRLHPALQSLWLSVAPMLVQFEIRRLEMALGMCWKHRADPKQLTRDIEDLEPAGHRRVEFARCLYHLELARQGIDSSRVQFAKRAGLLAEAYQDGSFAEELVGQDTGLLRLWSELKPYLDEFFETLEEQAARAQEGTRKVPMPLPPLEPIARPAPEEVEEEPAHRPQDETRRVQMPVEEPPVQPPLEPPSRPGLKTDPVFVAPSIAPSIAPVPLGEERPIPSFSALVGRGKHDTLPPDAHVPLADFPTPPGGLGQLDADVVFDAEPVLVEAAPPPPPVDLTPPGSWKPPSSDDLEIVEADFEAPPPPPPPSLTPAQGVAVASAVPSALDEDIEFDFEPDEATLNFWDYTFASLQQAPAEGQKPRMLATESRTDRKRLTTWLDGMGEHLAVPEAKAFAALVRLLLAAETKEKSLFGQANPRRKEALGAALSMLAPTPEAAGKAAVWFELDGIETRDSLMRGLELIYPFLSFCCRHSLDPLVPTTVAKYLEEA